MTSRGTAGRPLRRLSTRRLPTPRELDIVLAYLETGRYDLAAERVGCSTGYVADVLESVRHKAGAVNTPQAIWRFRIVIAEHERRQRRQQVPHENKA